MAFFNDEPEEAGEQTYQQHQHQAYQRNDQTSLALMRAFETRLWELDVQVQGIKCIGFGPSGPPTQMADTVLRCSQVGVAVVRRGPDGYCPLSLEPQTRPLLLAESVGAEQYELFLVTAPRGCEILQRIFSFPVDLQDLDTLVQFMLSYHLWCG